MRRYPVGKGWWPMLDEALAEAKAINPSAEMRVRQRFGVCFINFYPTSVEFDAIEARIEEESQRICESCGKPGQPRKTNYNWLLCRCDECFKTFEGSDTR